MGAGDTQAEEHNSHRKEEEWHVLDKTKQAHQPHDAREPANTLYTFTLSWNARSMTTKTRKRGSRMPTPPRECHRLANAQNPQHDVINGQHGDEINPKEALHSNTSTSACTITNNFKKPVRITSTITSQHREVVATDGFQVQNHLAIIVHVPEQKTTPGCQPKIWKKKHAMTESLH